MALFASIAVVVVEQHLHRFDKLLRYGMQQSVLCVHVIVDQQLDHLQVLIVDGHEQSRTAQRIHTIDVDVLGFVGAR